MTLKQVLYEELLKVFWDNHVPTTLNRQGLTLELNTASAIFTHDSEQENNS